MADEFNLSPTNNTEKFLDDILRTAQGEQAQFNLVPNWRIEQYLEAIKNALESGGGGVVPTPTSSDNGKVLTVASGEAAWKWPAVMPFDHIEIFDDEITWTTTTQGTIHVTRLMGKYLHEKPIIVTIEYMEEESYLRAIEYNSFSSSGDEFVFLSAPANSPDQTYVSHIELTITLQGEITGNVSIAML